MHANTVLAVVVLSICPPLCLSHACFVTKPNNAPQIFLYHFIPHKRAITLVFWHQQGWWTTPLLSKFAVKVTHPFEKWLLQQIFAYNISIIRDGEKSLIMTNRKSTIGFPMSYRWSAYVTPQSPKGWLKKRCFCFLNKI